MAVKLKEESLPWLYLSCTQIVHAPSIAPHLRATRLLATQAAAGRGPDGALIACRDRTRPFLCPLPNLLGTGCWRLGKAGATPLLPADGSAQCTIKTTHKRAAKI